VRRPSGSCGFLRICADCDCPANPFRVEGLWACCSLSAKLRTAFKGACEKGNNLYTRRASSLARVGLLEARQGRCDTLRRPIACIGHYKVLFL